MRIQHNIAALNAHRQLGGNNSAVAKNLEKLSSGFRINRAGDDAAGLAISEKMRSQIKGLETASKNAEDGVSLIQTAEGALTEVHSMLNRMVELATQSANGTYGDAERKKLNSEVISLKDEIDRISNGTDFNGKKLLDGSISGDKVTSGKKTVSADAAAMTNAFDFTVNGGEAGVTVKFAAVAAGTEAKATAAWGTDDDTLTITINSATGGAGAITQDMIDEVIKGATGTASTKATGMEVKLGGDITFSEASAVNADLATATTEAAAGTPLKLQVGDTNDSFQKVSVGIDSMSANSLGLDEVNIKTQDGAGEALSIINSAIETVSTTRSNLGAIQNRLDHTINNLGVTTENMTAAESRIRDVDMAKEMMDFTKNNILIQASQAMLAQANQLPQGVLQLLG